MAQYSGKIEKYEETPTHMINMTVGGKVLCIPSEKKWLAEKFPVGSAVDVRVFQGFVTLIKPLGEELPKPPEKPGVTDIAGDAVSRAVDKSKEKAAQKAPEAKKEEPKPEAPKPVQKPTEPQGAAKKAEVKIPPGASEAMKELINTPTTKTPPTGTGEAIAAGMKMAKEGDTTPTPPPTSAKETTVATVKPRTKKPKKEETPESAPEKTEREKRILFAEVPVVVGHERDAMIMQQNALNRAAELVFECFPKYSLGLYDYEEEVINCKDRLFLDMWKKSGMPYHERTDENPQE